MNIFAAGITAYGELQITAIRVQLIAQEGWRQDPVVGIIIGNTDRYSVGGQIDIRCLLWRIIAVGQRQFIDHYGQWNLFAIQTGR